MMGRTFIGFLLALAPGPLFAADPQPRPLTIEITANLEFSRMARTGSNEGTAQIDAQSGAQSTNSGFVGLGGITVQGRGRITGEPLRQVRIDLPSSVSMTTGSGDRAELTGLTTNLGSFPVLDANGVLEFSFGGRLQMSGSGGGNLRGRIPIQVDYN